MTLLNRKKSIEIPCKDCLVYPVCRHKTMIECSLIFEWMNKSNRNVEDLLKLFPHWESIDDGNIRYSFRRGRVGDVCVYHVKTV